VSFTVVELPGAMGLHMEHAVTIGSTTRPYSTRYLIEITTSRCTFGGTRSWFLCPMMIKGGSCDRRVVRLYLPPGAQMLGCRHCYDLRYESTQTHDKRVTVWRSICRCYNSH
jgi:hypothetical protein